MVSIKMDLGSLDSLIYKKLPICREPFDRSKKKLGPTESSGVPPAALSHLLSLAGPHYPATSQATFITPSDPEAYRLDYLLAPIFPAC